METSLAINAADPKSAIPAILGNKDLREGILAELRKNATIATLGNGQVFFLQEAGQTKRAFKVPVHLEYPTHFCFPAGAEAKAMITAEGFDRLNQYAGIEVFKPRTLIAQDGTEKGNPFFERDEKTGAMLSVFMRGIGIGYSPTGNLVAVDQTVFINLQTLLVQEIQAKIKRSPSLGCLGSAGTKPAEIVFYGDNGEYGRKKVINAEPTTIKTVGMWHFVATCGDLGYWVNLSHPEIQAAFESFTQKQRFLERTTFSILKRLILSSHPAIASKTPTVSDVSLGDYKKVESAKAYVIVYGFKADQRGAEEKHEELAAMADRVATGERMANMEVVKPTTHDAAEDAEIADPVAAGAADPTEVPPAPEPEPGEEPPPPPPVEPPPAAKPTNGNGDVKSRVSAIMKDDSPANIKKGKAALAAVGLESFGKLRTAPVEKMAEFVKAFEGSAS
jgi:hypothetical protein